MSWFPGSSGLSRSYLGRGLNGKEEGVGTGDRAKLEAGQEMKRSTHTFRSSLKTSAVEVKYGMTFLQCGHPVERESVTHGGRLQSQSPSQDPQRGLSGSVSHLTDCGAPLTPTTCTPHRQGPCINPAPQTTILCVCCWHEGFVGVPVQAAGPRLPRTSHPTVTLEQ